LSFAVDRIDVEWTFGLKQCLPKSNTAVWTRQTCGQYLKG